MIGRQIQVVVLLSIVSTVTADVVAQDRVFNGQGFQQNRDYFSEQPFEHIDTLTGGLILTFTDLVLPGNAGRELRFTRTYNSKGSPQWSFGLAGIPLNVGDVYWWNRNNPIGDDPGPIFTTADGGTHVAAMSLSPYDPNDVYARYRVMQTDQFWRYDRDLRTLWMPDGSVGIYDESGRLTQWKDPFSVHNVIDFDWTSVPGQLKVTQHLGSTTAREILLESGAQGALTRMTYSGRRWVYDGSSAYVRPEAGGAPYAPGWGFAGDNGGTLTVTTPHGGRIEYDFQTKIFVTKRDAVGNDTENVSTQVVGTRRVYDRGAGAPSRTWDYVYDFSDGLTSYTTTITASGGGQPSTSTTYRHGWPSIDPSVSNGAISSWPGRTLLLLSKTIVQGSEVELETRDYEYVPMATGSQVALPWSQFALPEIKSVTIRRGGAEGLAYQTTYDYGKDLDPPYPQAGNFHRARTITETGNAGTRTTSRTFDHGFLMDTNLDRLPIFLGKVQSETLSTTGGGSFAKSWAYDHATGFTTNETIYGIATSFTKDADGNVQSAAKGDKPATTFDYEHGVVKAIHTPEYSISRSINPEGTVASETRAGRETSFDYDGLFRIERTTPPGGANVVEPIITSYDNQTGATVTVTRGQSSTRTTVDGFGRPIGTVNSALIHTFATYDGEGRKIGESLPFAAPANVLAAPDGMMSSITYDGLGRMRRRTNPGGTFVEHTYNDELGTVAILDEEGRTTTHTRQAFGNPDEVRLAKVRDANATDWTYTYGALGQLLGVSTPDGVSRSWVYDNRNLLTSETQPESGTTDYDDYDAAGNLKHKSDANGNGTTYAYDDNNRLTGVNAGDRVTTITYETGTDNRATANVGPVQTRFDYDAGTGRLSRRRDTIDGVEYRTSFEYDKNDNVTTLTYPTGRIVRYHYDTENRIDHVWEDLREYATGFSYHPSGALAEYTAGNGLKHEFTYDPNRYWVTRIQAGNLLDLAYSLYDGVGNVKTIDDARAGMGQTFQYDALDRLKSASGWYGVAEYDYDVHGNRKTLSNADPNVDGYDYYSNKLRLWHQRVGGITSEFVYDKNGNLTSSTFPIATFVPTKDNLLASSTTQGVTTTYVYDADTWRVKKTIGDLSTYSLRGAGGELLTELSGPAANQMAKDYIYAGSRLLASTSVNGLPGAPRNLGIVSVQGDTVSLRWDASTSGGTVSTYVIEAGSASGQKDLPSIETGSAQTTFSGSGVTNGTYYVRVLAKNSAGTSGPSNEVRVLVGPCSAAPSAPTALTVAVSGSSVLLTWTAPSECPVTSYVIDARSATVPIEFETPTAATTYRADNVPDGTYYVSVRAKSDGGLSLASNEVVVSVPGAMPSPNCNAVPPNAPTGLWRTAGSSAIALAWNAHVGNCGPDSYVVEAGTASGLSDVRNQNTGSAAPAHTLLDLPIGTYFVRVRGVNTGGVSDPSNEIVAIVTCTPLAPSSLTGSAFGSTVTLNWTASAGSCQPTSYRIEPLTPAGEVVEPIETGSSATSFVKTDVAAGTYRLRVTARLGSELSPPSNLLIGCLPAAPTGLSVGPPGAVITLTWSPPAGCLPDGYVVEGGTSLGGTERGVFAAPGPSFTFAPEDAEPGLYFVRVRARAIDAFGLPSNELVEMHRCNPADLSGQQNGTAVTLTWTAPPAPCQVTSYSIEVGYSAGQSDAKVIETDNTATTYTDPEPMSGYYYVRVKAKNAQATSQASNEFPGLITCLPSAPTLSYSGNGHPLTLNWTPPGGTCAALDYEIQYGFSANAWDHTIPTTSTSHTIDVEPGSYYVRVRARGTGGFGEASNVINGAVTCNTPPAAPSGLDGSVNGYTVSLWWNAPPATCPATSYHVEAGSTPTGTDIASYDTGSAATALTFNNVQAGTYHVRISASNGYGTGQPSVINGTVTCVTPPAAPTNLSPNGSSGSTVVLSWTAPASACTVTSYLIEAGASPGVWTLPPIETGSAATTHTELSVAPGSYNVRVRARNAFGLGDPSAEIEGVVPCVTAPGAPTSLSGSLTGNTVSLWWTAPSPACAATSYVVEAGSSSGAANIANFDTGSAATSVTVPNVPVGTYYVRVRARNAYGTSGPSNEISGAVQCMTAPDAPGGLSGSLNGASVTLGWTASGGCAATSYTVEAGTSPGGQNVANTNVGGATSYTVGNVPVGTYYVRVRGHNAYGASGSSNEISGTVQCMTAPDAPGGLSGSLSGTSVTLGWNASGGCAATSYSVEAGTSPGGQNVANTNVGGATSYTVGNVPVGTYYVRVRGHNAYGASGSSNEISGTLEPPPCGAAPGAPGGLTGTLNGSSVSLSWSPPAGGCGATSYRVVAGSSSGGQNVAVIDTGSTSHTVPNVPAGTYYIRVHALNEWGISGASNEINGTIACGVPGAPTGLTGSSSGTSVTLTWNAGGGCAVTSHVIEVGSASGQSDVLTVDTGSSATSYTVTNAVAGTYYVRVRARNASGDSAPSNEVSGTVGP